jgi:protein-disulfide isomerase
MTTYREGLSTGLIVVAAVAVAAANIHREFFRQTPITATGSFAPPTYLKNWKTMLSAGTLIGDSAAPVKIIEFADLECPGCRLFHTRERQLPASMRSDVAVIFVHYPLSMHRFAIPAARAAECARSENKFSSLIDVLFDKQDSLGLKPWVAYAAEAGVRDTAAFGRCAGGTGNTRQIEAGQALGKTIGVDGTPTIIINGWRFTSPPYDSLPALVRRLVARNTL